MAKIFYMLLFLGLVVLLTKSIIINEFINKPKPQSKQLNHVQQLGKILFYDNNLSANKTKSCASCHDPKFAFTDGYRKSTGIEADNLLRNAPSLLNAKFRKSLSWANPSIITFEQQMLKPLFTNHPKELGLDSTDKNFLQRFHSEKYRHLFHKAFGSVSEAKNSENKNSERNENIETIQDSSLQDTSLITYQNIIKAIAEYEKILVSFNSNYDKYARNEIALNPSAMRGMGLFNSKELACKNCHIPPHFTDDKHHKISYKGSSIIDSGLFQATKNKHDIGKFKTPSLRNVMLTPPYMHDGSVEKISDAINHSVVLTQDQMQDMINFLQTLTDSTFIKDSEKLNEFEKGVSYGY